MKKVLSIFISLSVVLNILLISFFVMREEKSSVEVIKNYDSFGTSEALARAVDFEALKEALFNAFTTCEEMVDISSFNISKTTENINALQSLISYEMPECFHVEKFSYWYSSDKLTKIQPTYTVSKSEYQEMYSNLVNKTDALLQDIKNNNALNDVQKALLIHDRLALVCEYDYNNGKNRHSIYGAIVDGAAVCQGYAFAYRYLLDEIGIENYYCNSEKLNHMWNIVYIDDTPYHVDVTWDDYPWDNGERGAVGKVMHDNFLRSSEGIYSTEHYAEDYDTTPNDTKYDNYFWQKSETAFQFINNELYYIDNTSAKLKRYSDGNELCSVSAQWREGSWGNNACLSSDGRYLYYSLSKALYKFDVSAKTSEEIFKPSLSGYNCIYGFEYSNGYLVCDINDTPPCSGYGIDNLYQLKEPYSSQKPIEVTSIKIYNLPTKTTYYIGDTLDTSGLQLKLTYSDGSTKTVTSGFTTSGFSSTSAGTKTVTVSYEGKTATFNVTVKTPTITLSPTSKTLTVGDSSNITATTMPSGQSVTWVSSDTSIATVLGGRITAKTEGSVKITAKFTYNGKEYSSACAIIVEPFTIKLTGNITSFSNDTATTIKVLSGSKECDKFITTKSTYEFDIEPGTYTLEVSKFNHVTRNYKISITDKNVVQNIKIHLLGDITGDGEIDSNDISKANEHTKKVITLSDYEFDCADINGDEKVNTTDVAMANAHAKKTSLLW